MPKSSGDSRNREQGGSTYNKPKKRWFSSVYWTTSYYYVDSRTKKLLLLYFSPLTPQIHLVAITIKTLSASGKLSLKYKTSLYM